MNSLGVGLSPAEASDLLATSTSFVDGDFSMSAIVLLSRTLGLSPREMVKVRFCAPAFSVNEAICIDVSARTRRGGCTTTAIIVSRTVGRLILELFVPHFLCVWRFGDPLS